MKNKTLKNLIALGALAVFVLGVNSVSAAYSGYGPEYNASTYPYASTYNTSYNSYNPNQYSNYNSYNAQQQQQQAYAVQQQPYTYVQAQPATEIRYVPVETIKYVNTGTTQTTTKATTTQAASVANANTTARTTTSNTGVTGNTGQYVNYDANNQNMMGASAYGYNNVQPVAYSDNGVAALSVNGSGGFMPSSVFQWIMLVLIILAIVIVARMISKTLSNNSHSAPAH